MKKQPLPLPPQQLLRELFDYSPETGELRWRKAQASCSKKEDPFAAGYQDDKGYILVRICGSRYLAHRLIWMYVYGEDPGELEIDHIDRATSNNRVSNLRLANPHQQMRNQKTPCTNTSGYKGVSFSKQAGKFIARLMSHGRRVYLGVFDTAEEAAAAYEQASANLESEFTPDSPTGLPAPPSLPVHHRKRSDNTSGFRGASKVKNKDKWKATYRNRHLGYFDTPEEAAAAYQQAKEQSK